MNMGRTNWLNLRTRKMKKNGKPGAVATAKKKAAQLNKTSLHGSRGCTHAESAS